MKMDPKRFPKTLAQFMGDDRKPSPTVQTPAQMKGVFAAMRGDQFDPE